MRARTQGRPAPFAAAPAERRSLLVLCLWAFSSPCSSLAREPLRWGSDWLRAPRKGWSLTLLSDALEKCLSCVLASGESLLIPSMDQSGHDPLT